MRVGSILQARNALDLGQHRIERLGFGNLVTAIIKQTEPASRLLQREPTPMRAGAVEGYFFRGLTAGRPTGPDMISRNRAPQAVNGFQIGCGETDHV